MAGIAGIKPVEKSSGGLGGLIGKIFGGVAAAGAAAAAPFTGGTSLAALPAALGLAGAAAPVIGEVADPSSSGQTGGPTGIQVAAQNPNIQIAQLEEAKPLVANDPRIGAQEAQDTVAGFSQAQEALKKRLSLIG